MGHRRTCFPIAQFRAPGRKLLSFLGIKTASYAIRQYVLPLVETSKLKMTIPDRPGSPRQTYYKA